MGTLSVFGYSRVSPCGFSLSNNQKNSLRHFNKHLVGHLPIKLKIHPPIQTHLSCSNYRNPLVRKNSSIKCSKSDTSSGEPQKNPWRLLLEKLINFSRDLEPTIEEEEEWDEIFMEKLRIMRNYAEVKRSEQQTPVLERLKNVSIDSVKASLSRLTPIAICKWSLVLAVSLAAAKWSVNLVLNPFFWTYFSWTWLFWPSIVAVGGAIYGAYCLRKHLHGEASAFEQLAIVTSAFAWMTLVPPAFFNGYIEGWPFLFFLLYHYFFFFNVSVRKRMYGDWYPREHDPKWDISPPNWYRVLFCVGVMVAHWLAAFEAPELHLIPGGLNNLWVWSLILLTLFTQYHATWYLAKYSEKVMVPMSVVQYGPYRWVRHPIYASTMLLFVTYFAALRAPFSLLFVVAVCLIYYEQKARLEEALMTQNFPGAYKQYMKKVRYKFIPFIY